METPSVGKAGGQEALQYQESRGPTQVVTLCNTL